jgi:hypothetical protein
MGFTRKTEIEAPLPNGYHSRGGGAISRLAPIMSVGVGVGTQPKILIFSSHFMVGFLGGKKHD